jgi:hypothetical protein
MHGKNTKAVLRQCYVSNSEPGMASEGIDLAGKIFKKICGVEKMC